jgi:PAS domain S-box-containing protein
MAEDLVLTSSPAPVTTGMDDGPATLRRMVAQLVLDTTNEGIWLIDAKARTTFVNRHTASLLGYTEEEMIGMHIFAFLDEQWRPIAEQILIRLQHGIEERNEVKLTRKDGRPIWVIESTNAVFDRNGQYAGSLTLLGDLTMQKNMEQTLRLRIQDLRERLLSHTLDRNDAFSGGHAEDRSPYREPFRTAIVLGTYATLLATIALVTVGNVASALLRRPGARTDEPSEF